MSIEFARSYKTSDGKCRGTLKEAKIAEIQALLERLGSFGNLTAPEFYAQAIVENGDFVSDILSIKETSRPKARGGKKPRKNRVTEPVQTTSA